jgi:broad specificity phosphatase PhoE
MIFLVRHGERSDDGLQHEEALLNDEFDPPLTHRGYRQSVQSGLFLKEKLQELNL